MGLIITLILNTIAVLASAYFIPGVVVEGFVVAAAVAALLGIINVTLKPILKFMTFPITLGTLGLFSIVINAGMIVLVDQLISGFSVDNFLTAIYFSLVLSLITTIVGWISNKL